MEKHALAGLDYRRSAAFPGSALSLWREHQRQGFACCLGRGGGRGVEEASGREPRCPPATVETGLRDSVVKTEQCTVLFQTSGDSGRSFFFFMFILK